MALRIGQRVLVRGVVRWQLTTTEQVTLVDGETGEETPGEPRELTVDHELDLGDEGRGGRVSAINPELGARIDIDGDDIPGEVWVPLSQVFIRTPLDLRAIESETRAVMTGVRGKLAPVIDEAQRRMVLESAREATSQARELLEQFPGAPPPVRASLMVLAELVDKLAEIAR